MEARARSEGRTTSAGRPDGRGRGHGRAVIAPSVQGWVLPHLIAWVESRSVNASPIRRLFGRTRLDNPSVRVPEAVTERAWRLAATLTRDEALGIHLAESLPRGALDLIESTLRSSPSLGNGLDRLARYGRLLSNRVAARTTAGNKACCFSSTTPPPPRCTRHERNLRWPWRSSWRVTVRERTSHRSAFASLILHRSTVRSIGGSSTEVFGLPPVRAR